MTDTRKVDDFIRRFNDLSKDEKKETIKRIMPEFCQMVMGDKEYIQDIMPKCMDMMSGMNFSMKDIMSKMTGNT